VARSRNSRDLGGGEGYGFSFVLKFVSLFSFFGNSFYFEGRNIVLLPDHSSGAAFFDVFMAFTDFIPFFIAAMLLFCLAWAAGRTYIRSRKL